MREHWFHRLLKFLTFYKVDMPWKVGDTVVDDLTLTVCKVTGVQYADGRVGHHAHIGKFINYMGAAAIWIDNSHLDGGRHPWEISDPIPEKDIESCTENINKYRSQVERRREERFAKQQKR